MEGASEPDVEKGQAPIEIFVKLNPPQRRLLSLHILSTVSNNPKRFPITWMHFFPEKTQNKEQPF
jgi:hypothetical protein